MNAQRFQHIRAAAEAGNAAVAVFGHHHPAGRDNNGHDRRYIKSIFMVPAGTDYVQDDFMVGLDRYDEFPHDQGASSDLFDRRPLFIKGQ